MTERIVVGMSGGVDSSVAAALLVEQGYEVVGVTLRVWPWREPDAGVKRFGSCCSPETVDDAREVARRLGIRYYLLNSEREFDETVIETFTRSYAAGRTPVPCVTCNQKVKFGSLLGRARAWDAAAVATGHYARVTRDEDTGRYLLWRGSDPRKDQSDFLWPLSQAQLSAARFPVGGLTKDAVRERARQLGLPTADKPESQEICFIPDDDYRRFLRARVPESFRPGPIVDARGAILGRHQGLADFTVGQRRGLGLASGRALYVTALDPERNAVVVGGANEVEVERLRAEQVNFIALPALDGPLRVAAKIRHSHTPAPATIRPAEAADAHGSVVEVRFDRPQRAAAPGQSVVFYADDLVVGGGVIAARPGEGA
ncbi:MAG TPA: tRNA 2-thiouridine(34) synthase MnmA [Methylomirabilota bacterium]|jgi:tRNA-specific 2-thiouridylase|nr:tRNA 2-thiouridine(34) synthase MnmA [Methylomirabilota bacterium]